MHYTNEITKLCGTVDCSLEQVKNNFGDLYFTIRFRTARSGKFDTYTVYEFSSKELAYQYFNSLAGIAS